MDLSDRQSSPAVAAPTRVWGAVPIGDRRWRFELWAPGHDRAALLLQGRALAMIADGRGGFTLDAPAEAGDTYAFDLGDGPRPDPAARAQAGDVHAASRLVDTRFDWPASEAQWHGRPWSEAVILELHLGLFTPEGTFAAAAKRLPGLAALGITAVELMPVGQFTGDRGWGYDGVLPFAPHPAYGTPAEMAAFVAAAHAVGIAVILDVVYNHFGPDGAYLHEIAPAFFDADRHTPWGAGIAFERPEVRDFVLSNVAMWVRDYRIDGLRIDAAHQIVDASARHVLDEVALTARSAGGGREVWLILEDERNLAGLTDPQAGGFDAQWNDDYHHALHCLLTGEDEGYYAPFAVDPLGDLIRALAEGQVDQGQPRPAGAEARGEPSAHLPVTAFVNANQTHDQIGNRARGDRLIALAGEEAARTAHALLLLAPFVPMLFMGEEAGETAPFCFFADFPEPLASATRKGRAAEFAKFKGFGGEVPDPIAVETFEMSRPYRGDPARAADWLALTRELLALRARAILPLIASGRTGVPEVLATGSKAVEACWDFAAGSLQIRASLGTPPEAAVPWDNCDFRLGRYGADAFALDCRIRPTHS
ncbi:malto-oligosyltrehalose trehalohydrolase [Frigidibacter sp. MR17.14]|uniref:malto-oligosyltrehalose trehalohydrolase n=1 Tax=Frigidibacter sp. MR17.14 TaxID=3126509 RepID=UPI003012D317